MTGKELKERRKDKGLSSMGMAKLLGLANTTYSNYENEIRPIPSDVEDKAAEILGSKSSPSGMICPDDVVPIDFIDLKAGMGPGVQNGDLEKIGQFFIEKRYIMPYHPKELKAVFVVGDSMTPTLFDGDVVIYAPGIVRDNGVYVVEVMGEYRCKRVEFKADRSMRLISDNSRYEPELVSMENETVRVEGKVVGWFHLHRY